jgi:hypothetical protein
MSNPRADGLTPNEPFWVIGLYDKEGYYASVVAPTFEGVLAKAAARMDRNPTLTLAAQWPFQGTWAPSTLGDGVVPDVTPPP